MRRMDFDNSCTCEKKVVKLRPACGSWMDTDHLWSSSSPFAKYADKGVVSPGVQLVHSSTNMTQELSAVRLPSGSVAECRHLKPHWKIKQLAPI